MLKKPMKKIKKAVKSDTKKRAEEPAKKNIQEEKKPIPAAGLEDDEQPVIKGPKGKLPSLLRGMKDVMPKDWPYWKKIYHTAENIAEAYGFGYLETPVLEEASLFIRSIGRGTDIIEKEMYVFDDRDGTRVGMRPEFTAGAVRAYISHGMHTLPQPVKLWSFGQLFRHDRPQAGRYRQLHQFNCESFGAHDPAVDAELIVVAYNFLRDLGIETTVQMNSIGTPEDRQNYLVELTGYLRTKRSYLCEDCKKRITRNPLRALDCKNESCRPTLEEAPQIVDWLSDASKNYFMKVLEFLDELEVPYTLKPTLVRGLDYYTETVFEIYEDPSTHSVRSGQAPPVAEGQQSALCGGGRYDLLVEELGGPPTPACGFALGVERVMTILRRKAEENKDKIEKESGGIFFAHLGEQARRRTLKMIEDLRRDGVVLHHCLGKTALKAQLELANKFGVAYTLILGQKEAQDGTIIIRDMESGIQEIVDQKKLKSELEKKTKNTKHN
ncbi:MAG: histidine--tRNA ligase [Candidatus Magasanikbacteria bacterium]|nr:histidine--tRNA ligase [Candidatus Magasanikbacteria bacterium]